MATRGASSPRVGGVARRRGKRRIATSFAGRTRLDSRKSGDFQFDLISSNLIKFPTKIADSFGADPKIDEIHIGQR